MNINVDRMKRRFQQLNKIGRSHGGGINRLALTDTDKEARDLFLAWLKELDLELQWDDLGNIYGVKPGVDDSLKPILIGSHLDSVPDGGAFDGVLGVLTGLEVIETLKENQISHRFPVGVVNFTNEEGARFPIPMTASGVLSSIYPKEKMYHLHDENGDTIEQELQRIGFQGKEKYRITDLEAFLELHIEQGPVLEEKGAHIGIVDGIQGLSWQTISVYGEADHAGPSPMSYRKDAGIAAMRAMLSIHDWVNHLNDGTLVTFGKIQTIPDTINVIPGGSKFSLDIRHPDNNVLLKRQEECLKRINDIITLEGCSWDHESLSYMAPVSFHPPFVKELEQICRNNDYAYQTVTSGAGHDAMHMNQLAPAVMVFVPSINGKSHNKEEVSRWEDIGPAVDVIYEWIVQYNKI
ncbi:M20 family metallo-hydrolase [Salibacterium aidingense]|uniref:M20 family metallo-hydrolase n=1 Tax=Salibacterium aidingense TaxID=384933 RepID=UPI000409D55A|nr:M20 family metallo-hydrolase [Salibacterium aidingense]